MKILLTLPLLLSITIASSQDISKTTFSIDAGASSPLGEFKSTYKPETGFNIQASNEIPVFHSSFGISSMVGYFQNTISPTENIINGSFKSQYLLSGIYWNTAVKKLHFLTTLNAGINHIQYKSQFYDKLTLEWDSQYINGTYNPNTPAPTGDIENIDESKYSLMIYLSESIRYGISQHFFVNINIGVSCCPNMYSSIAQINSNAGIGYMILRK